MTDTGNLDSPERLAFALPILRGLLALPSDNPDNPHVRCIFRRTPAASAGAGAPALALPADALEGDEEAVRGRLSELVQAFARAHGALPERIDFSPGGRFEVVREDVTEALPLADKVGLVTGASGAIGAGICRGLLRKGCRVVATDVQADALAALKAELDRSWPGRVAAAVMDVAAEKSVQGAFAQAVLQWGGLDIVIPNAGIAMVSTLTDMGIDAFRKVQKVNVDGTLLTLGEAGRWLIRQGTGGDIVLTSTKNVFAPGAQFGAYSATKAASHQLARIASLEYAPHDIRVNMVAPDAVFSDSQRKSGLWAEVGPSRMRARGLDEQGLEEYYRNRNLLKARITADHVANAVLFFVTRQTPTTGATIPVDGGLPDATPR